MANNNEEGIDREISMQIKRARLEDSPGNHVLAPSSGFNAPADKTTDMLINRAAKLKRQKPNKRNNLGNLTLQQLAGIDQRLQAQKQALIQQIRDEKLDLAFTRSKSLIALEILSIPFYDRFWYTKQELFTQIDKVILEYEKAFSNSIKEPINSIATALIETENEHNKIDQEMTTVRTQLDQIIREIESANSDIAQINETLSDTFDMLVPNLKEAIIQRLSELKTIIDDGSERKNQLEKEMKTLTERCAKNDSDLNSCREKVNLIQHIPTSLEELRALVLQSIEEVGRFATMRRDFVGRSGKDKDQELPTIHFSHLNLS